MAARSPDFDTHRRVWLKRFGLILGLCMTNKLGPGQNPNRPAGAFYRTAGERSARIGVGRRKLDFGFDNRSPARQ